MRDIMRLIPYIRPYRLYVAIAAFTMAIQVFVSFFIPFLMIEIIDHNLRNGDFTGVVETGLLMIGLALLGIACGVINTYTSQYISQYATADLRLGLFRRIQTLSFKNVDDLKQSRLITNATNDVMRVEVFFTMLLRIVLRAPLMIVIGLVMALSTSLLLSQVFFVTVPLLLIAIVIIMIHAYPRFKKVQLALDDLNNVALENANAPQVIKSFVSQNHENDRYDKTNEHYRKVNTGAETVMAFADPVINLIFNIGLAGILFAGAYYLNLGELLTPTGEPEVGLIMAFNAYSQQILIGLMMFAMIMIFLSRANVSAARINEIFDAHIDLENPTDPVIRKIGGKITFEDVSFGYGDNGNPVLSDLNFQIEPGEKIGVIGSTGSGKSTLTYLIPRLYDTKKGKVLIDDISVDRYDISNLRDQIGFVTQSADIFSGSLATNLYQGRQDADQEALLEAAEAADLDAFVRENTEGFNHLIRAKGVNLSGGQKQRLSIGRALVKKPRVLVFDDATSAVDAATEHRILSRIDKLDHRPTLILISQKIATVRRMDRILVLDNQGFIDGFSNHEDLLETSEVYKEIAASQLDLGGASDV